MQQLGTPSQTGSADFCSLIIIRKRFVIPGNQNVKRIGSFRNGANAQPVRKRIRHILHAMNCKVNLLVQKGILNFLDKKPFAANKSKRPVCDSVPGGFNNGQLDTKIRQEPLNFRFDKIGLPQSQITSPRTDTKIFRHSLTQ